MDPTIMLSSRSIPMATELKPIVAELRSEQLTMHVENMPIGSNARSGAHYHLFDTALGICGIAWSGRGLMRLQLPERDRPATEARLRAHSTASAPSAAVKHLVVALQHYFVGRRCDFSNVELDLGGVSPFHHTIYNVTRSLDWGQTTSYGDLALRAGSPGSARAVGQAMARNPIPVIIPCHRVLASRKKIGGFSAFGGAITKERLLMLEGISFVAEAPLLAALEPHLVKS